MTDYVTEISLREVRKLIEDKLVDDSVLNAVDGILSLSLVLSPLIAGPVALPLLGLIEPKNELIKLVKNAIKKLIKPQPKDYLDQATRLTAANCLLTYSAYFDALQRRLPRLMRNVKLTDEEKKQIVGSRAAAHPGASMTNARQGPNEEPGSFKATDLASRMVSVPHPADSVSQSNARLTLYRAMSENLITVLSGSDEIWGQLTEQTRNRIKEVAEREIPDQANVLYQAEFLGMAIDCQQFFLWSVLTDQSEKDKLISKVGTDVRTQFELVGSALNVVDIGLQRLNLAINNISQSTNVVPLDHGLAHVAEDLHRCYADGINQPIIDDTYTVDEGAPQLTYPAKVRSYVPQGYRVAVYREKTQHLEKEDEWDKLSVSDDLGPFVVAHLESPYSVQTPLLILGHPGSGKSLLTEVIAARLAYPAYTTVRIELRDVDPDTEIQSQIEAQIYRDTGREVNWVDFASNLAMSPPVVIFDGYDELLQATGKLHADYLDRIRKFQHREAVVHHHPVRVIVTSRITLINKAIVPPGTTILRLEEFDRIRREAWSGVWNDHNGSYFRQADIQPFSVPANPKVEELARQPLLLLMLALYDSSANKLSAEPDIDQTRLYDELLIRFIERELAKGKDGIEFLRLPERERQAQVDRELERLGVAAIGMFNRQSVVIQREQLNADLAYFDTQSETAFTGVRGLSQADLLLGSFFFIHESRTRLTDNLAEPSSGPSAFEFLHNTFGEFLAADFILRKVLGESDTVRQLSANPKLSESLKRELISLPEDWFACLIHTPLHTRPVILGMLKEWGSHQLGRGGYQAEHLRAIDEIVLAQLRALLIDATLPQLSAKGRQTPYTPLPALGQLAVYSLNLILLRCYLSDGSYALYEAALGTQPDGCRAWDRLTSLWRSWFSPESLSALTSLITVTRQESVIIISSDGSPLAMPHGIPLTAAYNAALAFADNLIVGSMGLHLAEVFGMPENYAPALRERVKAESEELMTLIDFAESRTSRRPPAALPVSSRRYQMRFWELPASGQRENDWQSQPPGQLLTVTDMAGRFFLTPSQRAKIDIHATNLNQFIMLSRYAADVIVETNVSLEPRWLAYLLLEDDYLEEQRRVQGQRERRENAESSLRKARIEVWRSLLAGPAAAPALRGTLLHFIRPQYSDLAARIDDALTVQPVNLFDADTAAAVVVLSWRGRSIGLCTRILDFIIESCSSGAWKLSDIPEQLWGDLADILVSSRTNTSHQQIAFSRLLDQEIPSITRPEDRSNNFSDVELLVQGLRIGSKVAKQNISHIVNRIFDLDSLFDNRQRRWFLLLMRWALGSGQRKLAEKLLNAQTGHLPPRARKSEIQTGWRYLLGVPDGQDLAMLDVDDLSADLTTREVNDLRWIIGVMRQKSGDRLR